MFPLNRSRSRARSNTTGGEPPVVVDPPENTVAPVVSGTTRVGEVLSTTDGTWTGDDIVYSYQWKRDGVEIGGATADEYTLVLADLDKDITCTVTATNDGGAVDEDSNAIAMGISLDYIVPNVEFHCEVTVAASYPGSGNVIDNLVAAPQSGAAQADYDLTKAGAGNFTFVGSAGDPGAYINITGDASCRFGVAANTTWLKNLGKTTGGQDFCLIWAGKFQQNDANQIFLGTQNAASEIGIGLTSASTENLSLRQQGDSAATNTNLPNGTLVDATDYLIGASHGHTANTTGQSRLWLNTDTATQANHVMNTTTTDPVRLFAACAGGNSGSAMPADTRFKTVAGISGYMDNTTWAKITAYFEYLHAINYVA